ncbi:MAG TPA: GNAT family N-acetyltransferase [Kiloniellales bacterium]|nr:GNAT family N-acetyltransferase [Kiloniellales bacterium]
MDRPVIRPCVVADAPAIGLLIRQLLEVAVPPERLTAVELLAETAGRLLRDGKMVAWLAESEGRPVGLITATTVHAIYARGAFGEINEVYVEPDFRATGLAPRLIETVRAHGRTQGWSRIQLSAPQAGTAGAERAYAFYARLGFGDVGPTFMVPL